MASEIIWGEPLYTIDSEGRQLRTMVGAIVPVSPAKIIDQPPWNEAGAINALPIRHDFQRLYVDVIISESKLAGVIKIIDREASKQLLPGCK